MLSIESQNIFPTEMLSMVSLNYSCFNAFYFVSQLFRLKCLSLSYLHYA